MVVALAVFPYAREAGTGAGYASATRWQHAAIALALAMLVGPALMPVSGAALVGAGIVVALATGAYVTRRLGGLTGDVYGAINELTEVVVLLAGGIMLGQV